MKKQYGTDSSRAYPKPYTARYRKARAGKSRRAQNRIAVPGRWRRPSPRPAYCCFSSASLSQQPAQGNVNTVRPGQNTVNPSSHLHSRLHGWVKHYGQSPSPPLLPCVHFSRSATLQTSRESGAQTVYCPRGSCGLRPPLVTNPVFQPTLQPTCAHTLFLVPSVSPRHSFSALLIPNRYHLLPVHLSSSTASRNSALTATLCRSTTGPPEPFPALLRSCGSSLYPLYDITPPCVPRQAS